MSVEIHSGKHWSQLVLTRPPRNVLNLAMLRELIAALDHLVEEGGPLLLLTASGRHFSTGYDIGDIPAEIFAPDSEVRSAHPFEQLMERLNEYPAPIVAAVQGDAYGGAVELLACADLRVAADDVRLGVPPVRLGLIYSHTGLRRMLRVFGSTLAREMLLTGEPITAERAREAGFFARVVARDHLDDTAEGLLAAMARGGPEALRGTRRILNMLEDAEALGPDELAEIAELRHRSRSSEEFAQARAAFLERRPSPFDGAE